MTVALAAACSGGAPTAAGPVTLSPAVGLTSDAETGCAALVALLPVTVGGATRRVTAPDPRTTAAWGEPPITLVCGGPSGSPLDETFSVDGVRFAIHDIGAGNTWTTLDRTPAVVVTMPDHYENQAELIGALVGPLTATG